jgi:hypothetical protein
VIDSCIRNPVLNNQFALGEFQLTTQSFCRKSLQKAADQKTMDAAHAPGEGCLKLFELTHIADFTRHDDLVPVADGIFNQPDVRRLENRAVWNFQDCDRFVIPVHDYSVSVDVGPIGDIT